MVPLHDKGTFEIDWKGGTIIPHSSGVKRYFFATLPGPSWKRGGVVMFFSWHRKRRRVQQTFRICWTITEGAASSGSESCAGDSCQAAYPKSRGKSHQCEIITKGRMRMTFGSRVKNHILLPDWRKCTSNSLCHGTVRVRTGKHM